MRQTVTKMIGIASCEDLRFRLEPAKSTGMNEAVAVAGIFTAVRMSRFRKTAAASFFRAHGPRGRGGKSCDGSLHLVPRTRDPSAARIRISAKSNPSRGRPARKYSCPGILSYFVDRCSLLPLDSL